MTWRDQLRPATFRGTPFFVQSHEATGGRKIVPHEYPLRDEAYVEDLGRKGRRFTVNGYVLGTDYFAARDALVTALEKPGTGALVHPYIGEKQVAVGDYSYSEEVDEGGVARFSMVFTESAAAAFEPRAKLDAPSAVLRSANGAISTIKDGFSTIYRVASQPQFALDSLSSLLGEHGAFIRDTLSPILSTSSAAAGLIQDATDLVANAGSISRDPATLVLRVLGMFESVRGLIDDDDAMAAYVKIARFEPATPAPAPLTEIRAQESGNQDALTSTVRQLAIIEAARLAPTGTYDSYEAALSMRTAITDVLDVESETAPDETFEALRDLRAQVVKAVPAEDNDLAHLITLTPTITVPALVLAYNFYEDSSREADIVSRNGIRHPGFVPGGVPLEVLSRDT